MAHTSINQSQVRNFIGEQSAPFLFNPPILQKSSFAVALAAPGEPAVENLRAQIYRSKPQARIFEAAAPEGKDSFKQYRGFLSELLYRLDEPAFHHGQETGVAVRLPKLLSARYDYVIIDHAERMGAYSMDVLRKDRGCPSVFLVAYDDRILDTLLSNEALLSRVYMLS
jgi:hypothetical protein